MNKKKRNDKPSVVVDWHEIWNELGSTNDRAAAIVGEAILDQGLSALLSNYLVNNEDEVASLADYRGPLSSLYAKATLAYCLGLITHGQLKDFRAINKIRNHFAHRLHGTSFGDQAIKKMVSQIEPYKRFLASEDEESPRKQFNVAIGVLAYALSVESSAAQHCHEKESLIVSEELKRLLSSFPGDLKEAY